jgi:UDP-N-acetylmuramyl pentapeptide synthase
MHQVNELLCDATTRPIVVACGAAAMTQAMIRTVLGEECARAIEVCEPGVECSSEIPADAIVVLDGDHAVSRRLHSSGEAKTLWVGRGAGCDLTATHVQSSWGHLRFCVDEQEFDVPVWGRHHLSAALAAIAVARLCGLSLEQASAALTRFRPLSGYCDVFPASGATLIDDTCDSNRTSSRAALELLREFPSHSRRIVVCGDVEEAPTVPARACCELGEEVVVCCGADLLVACGAHAAEIRAGAMHAGMPRTHAAAFRTPDEAVEHLRRTIRAGDTVLFQGSPTRGMRSVVDQLRTPHRREAA